MLRPLAPVLIGALLLAGCASGEAARSAGGGVIQISVDGCGRGWTDQHAGLQTLTLHDTDSRDGEVQVVGVGTGEVFGEVGPVGAGTTVTMPVSLSAGRYAIRCVLDDEAAVTGPTVTLTGSAKGTTPGVVPVSEADLIPATQGYEHYVEKRLPVLAGDVARLRKDIDGGALASARRAWLTAQLAYLSIGAAYSAFGDEDGKIDARADGFPLGVHDPHWQGLHRLQYGLWHGQSARTLAPIAATLVTSVATLRREFPDAQLDPSEIAIRAHEITENAVEFSLTGRDDYGAHAALPEVAEDITATRTVLALVRPLLRSRYPDLAGLDAQLATAAHDLAATRHGSSWPAPAALPRLTHERINADFSELAELLAPVAAILEPRRTS